MENAPISIYCPFCNQHTSLTVATTLRKCVHCREERAIPAIWEKTKDEWWWIGICNNCQDAVLVGHGGEVVYPNPQPEPTSEEIPEKIRKDLQEAKLCFSIAACRACAVMARRAMQSTCIDKGADQNKKLHEQLKQLADSHAITSDLHDWATEVRWTGNDAAHPGGDEVTKEDAEEVLELAEQFCEVIYVTSALARKRIAARAKKRTAK